MTKKTRDLIWKTLAMVFLPPFAVAATVVADFNDLNLGDISNTTLQPSGTGSGFTENYWGIGSSTSVIVAIEGDLSAPASTNYAVTQSGNARMVTNDNPTAKRRRHREITPLSGTVWFSFLAQSQDDQARAFLDFNTSDSRDEVRTSAVSIFDNRLIVWNDSSSGSQFANEFTYGQTALVLGKLVIGGGATSGNDALDIWIDPDVSGGEGGLTGGISFSDIDLIGADTSLTQIGVQSYRENTTLTYGGLIDSIRLSDESDGFDFVTGIPEPGSLALMLLGAGVFAAGNLSRRRSK